MNPTPNQTYNVIKGLQIFINDIRGCTTKEAETKRVEKELDKIRKKFSASKALTGYEKKKNIWKLLYIYILGYHVDFGYSHSADLITSSKFSEKLTGVMLKENSPEIGIMINSIRNDLLNQNNLCQSMALTLAANLNNSELLLGISNDVLKYLTNWNEKHLHTVKKGLICLTKILKLKKELHDSHSWSKYIVKMLDVKNIEILLPAANFTLFLINTFGPTGYEEVANRFVSNVLHKIKECPEDYNYYQIKAPWLQIKILKIVQLISPALLAPETIGYLKEFIEEIGKKSYATTMNEAKSLRFYSKYCIFFEVINVVDHLNAKLPTKIFDTYVSILGNFLKEDNAKYPNKDINTKYLALDGMAKLAKYSSGDRILKEHSNIIYSSLKDNDISIRRRSLDLLFLVCSVENVKSICKEMLLYFKEDEPQLKEDIALKLAILAEKYTTDLTWYIDICLKLFDVAGEYVSEDIIYRIVQIITGFEGQGTTEQLQHYACEKVMKLLEKDYVHESVVKLAAVLFDEENGFERLSELLLNHMSICGNNTKYSIFNAIMKIVNINPESRSIAIPLFEQYLESWDPELQQRAVENILLCKLDHESTEIPNISAIRENIYAKMPLFSLDTLNNSILIKKLQNSQKTLFNNQLKESSTKSISNDESTIYPKKIAEQNFKFEDSHNIGNETNCIYTDHIIYQKDPNGFAMKSNKFVENMSQINKDYIAENAELFKSLITNSGGQGIIYSDQNLKVEVKARKIERNCFGIMFNFVGSNSIEDITLSHFCDSNNLSVSVSAIKYTDSTPQALLKANLVGSFTNPPMLSLKGTMGMATVSAKFSLPILITKFLTPHKTTLENHSIMWFTISNENDNLYHKLDSILINPSCGKIGVMDFLKKLGALFVNLGFHVYPPADINNFHDLEAAARIDYKENGEPIIVLLQASFIPSYLDEFRFSIRAKVPFTGFDNITTDILSAIKFYVNP